MIVIELFIKITKIKCTKLNKEREEIKIFVFLYRDCGRTFYSNHRDKVYRIESKNIVVEKKLKFFVFFNRDCDRNFY